MVETSKSSIDNLERLRLLAYSNNLTRLYCIRRNVNHLTVDNNVLVSDKLTSCSTCGSNTQTENYVVKTALQVLKKHLTGDTISLGCILKHITELTL